MCKRRNITPPVYLDTIEDKGDVFLVRLKGALDKAVLGANREKMTAVIDAMKLDTKNVLVDFKKMTALIVQPLHPFWAGFWMQNEHTGVLRCSMSRMNCASKFKSLN